MTLQRMKEYYGTNPEDVLVGIGPSICQECYEVSADVIGEFASAFPNKQVQEMIYYQKSNGKYQLNLWEANKAILLDAGIKDENISVTDICTCCNPKYLFSHRAGEGKRGNLAAFLGLK